MSVKLTQEELDELRSSRELFQSTRAELGNVTFQIEMLERRKQRLVANYDMHESAYGEAYNNIQEKYGKEVGADFEIDLSTGELRESDGQD